MAFPHVATVSRTEVWLEEGKKTYPLFEQLAIKLYRAGAVMSVGTDMMNPWMTPGTSYHRELQLLKEPGLTEAEILVAATKYGAIAMQLESEIGSIAKGMVAALLILDADPM